MGSCFSAPTSEAVAGSLPPTAKVITHAGHLREFSSPIKASLVLGDDHGSSSLCNSDALFYDEYVPVLKPEDLIIPGCLYFVLPAEKLEQPLTGADMAALAVKASTALQARASGGKGGKVRGCRVMPIMVVRNKAGGVDEEDLFYADEGLGGTTTDVMKTVKSTRPVAARKLMKRSGSVRSRLVRRLSGRSRLSTIDEVAE